MLPMLFHCDFSRPAFSASIQAGRRQKAFFVTFYWRQCINAGNLDIFSPTFTLYRHKLGDYMYRSQAPNSYYVYSSSPFVEKNHVQITCIRHIAGCHLHRPRGTGVDLFVYRFPGKEHRGFLRYLYAQWFIFRPG
jgi:hypothetical protein